MLADGCKKAVLLILQEFQEQLDALQKDKSMAVGELQAELAGLKTACAELRKVQEERDAALQATAQIRDQHAAVSQVSVHSCMVSFSSLRQNTKCEAANSSQHASCSPIITAAHIASHAIKDAPCM